MDKIEQLISIFGLAWVIEGFIFITITMLLGINKTWDDLTQILFVLSALLIVAIPSMILVLILSFIKSKGEKNK